MSNQKSDEAVLSGLLIQKHEQALSEYDQIWDRLITAFEQSRLNWNILRDLGAAGRVFGLDLDIPEKSARISAQDFYLSPKARALRVEDDSAFIDYSELAAEVGRVTTPPPASAPEHAMPRVRDVVLERLKVAGPNGTRAAPIREYIKGKYGRDVHEKTVGMTLYRLAVDRLAHRVGITWFFGPASPDTKNPGAGAPGPEGLL